MIYEPVIGIEVHAQLKTQTKLFCNCSTRFGVPHNTNVCPVCLGLPGALPVLNRQAVLYAIQVGLAFGCEIHRDSVFARKNYFYPDLPKGYQISQFEKPILTGGEVPVQLEGASKSIRLTRIHMEEDAGKLVHQGAAAIAGSQSSFADFNRACVPLLEIVSEPDIRSAAEAKAYAESLRLLLVHLGVCDGNMDEGSLRADVNISLRPVGTLAFGTKVEIKNVNSFRSIERAIFAEIERQTDLLNAGKPIIQQTRHYDDFSQTTHALRDKEDSQDYRYFPDPDLIPLRITDALLREAQDTLPETPAQKTKRYADYGLGDAEQSVLIGDPDIAWFFDACIVQKGKASAAELCKWLIGDLNALLKDSGFGFANSPVSPVYLVELVELMASGTLSGKLGKEILAESFKTGKSPQALVQDKGVSQISDTGALQAAVDQVLAENPDVVEKIRNGKTASANFLMGQVMKLTQGRANPDLVRQLILDTIK